MDLIWVTLNGLEPLLGCVAMLHLMIYGDSVKIGTVEWDQIVEWHLSSTMHNPMGHTTIGMKIYMFSSTSKENPSGYPWRGTCHLS
jgi:hypothetical protein